ncbi:protein SRG1-like [Gastrolobium bilobum]|uniref:protein SRG1-like n=1 Tax=Gastrolobium bilobum TaxID=150636 RepID=UPI002AAF7426|nr:protein SRG1-like [Gastrolobium bilobum]
MASSHASVFGSTHSVLGMMDIANKPENGIPEMYIRPELEPPSPLDETTPLPTIPIFDLKTLVCGNTRDTELEKLYLTCKDWGFFQVVNHGVSSQLLEKLKSETEKFFKLPNEEKMKYQIRPGDVQGYGTVIRCKDQKLDWGDRFYMVINPVERRKPYLFPELPTSLRDTLESYISETRKLGMILLGLIGKTINMDIKEMEKLFDNGMQSVRMTCYPPCPQPELVVGITPHSDATGITILHQVNGVEGLEIKKDGVWIPVTFLPDAFVVNVGDIMEILSNGAYTSIEHRAAVNREKERISIAMFFNPKFEAEIGPGKSLISVENPPLFKSMLMEDYFKDFFSRNLNGKSHLEKMRIKTFDGVKD